jgi:ABC-2 type transport system ATP-binding protein
VAKHERLEERHASLTALNAPLVAARGLVKRYADVVAVNGLDLTIARGECLGLLGPNGAGKTTTVEMLEGLTAPDEGTIEIFSHRWGHGSDREIRKRIGVQLQETQLGEKLTVEETLELFRSFYDEAREVKEVISELALDEKRKSWVGKLSGGQKQRLAIGCALVGKPEILFLDEPTTGLDPQARRNLWEIVERFRAGGGTVCLTTHYMEEAAQLCSRVAIIDHGRIIAEGSPAQLIAGLGAPELIELDVDRAFDPEDLSAISSIGSIRKNEHSYVLSARSAAEAVPDLLHWLSGRGIALSALATRRATLEDVFIHLTGRGLRDG